MNASDEEITNLYRVRKTVTQMLNDRGYFVTDDEMNMTKQQFIQHYGGNMTRDSLFMLKNKRDNTSDQIFVFFPLPEPSKQTIGIGPLRKCIERMQSEKVFNAILVVQHNLTPAAKKATQIPNLRLEIFLDSELLYNVTEHDLVPEHQVLTEEEKKAVLEKYRVKESQLPKMLASDVIARHYGLQHGHVVKIIRPSENAGRYITYRYVV
ncbi:DNA-directed RNA polymerases II and IV subunit 5A [Beta vulgaris subsp. vulgaris]|uniref:DNA-directed RNA polymerases II and IV subunit 5A n=1 Tax=Beta vulgaris subsp. vulgaris TaxID=3555 RepID=UPI0020372C59|nr:DNA-directed RNA polymerases II and IV subunit 5A [Beta vulgaris subsp. vulgaris]